MPQRIQCPRCRAQFKVAGVAIVQCPNCKYPVATGANAIAGSLPKAAPPRTAGAPEPKSGKSWLLALLIGGLALAVVFVLGLVLVGGVLWYKLSSANTTEVASQKSDPIVARPGGSWPSNDPPPIIEWPNRQPPVVSPPTDDLPQPTPPPGGPPTAPAGNGESIPALVLKRIKAATVFVKVSTGPIQASGTGFVMHTQGDTGYVVTNDHVISPGDADAPASRRGAGPPPRISIVFGSGTAEERIVEARIAATDPDRDLAVLKISANNLPEPVDINQKPELVETMPVFICGFPFGAMMRTNKGNPAITIDRGTVSSIRLNDRGELAVVQIGGAINPGNSGGPIVDARGRLCGVAVATIRGSGIGLAIPPDELTKMLNGRVSTTTFSVLPRAGLRNEVKAEVRLIDPLDKIKQVSLRYFGGAQIPANFKADKDGRFPPLPNSSVTDLVVGDQRAVGTIPIPGTERAIVFQTVYVDGEGREKFTAASVYRPGQGVEIVGDDAGKDRGSLIKPATGEGGWIDLGKSHAFPDLLDPSKDITMEPDGWRIARRHYVRTKAGYYLNHNFRLEVVFSLKRNDNIAFIGIGEGDRNSDGNEPKNSVFLRIRPPGINGGTIDLTNETMEEGLELGKLSKEGTHRAVILKRGGVITFFIDENNTGGADGLGRTLYGLREIGPFLKGNNTHLFFGSGGMFHKFRIIE